MYQNNCSIASLPFLLGAVGKTNLLACWCILLSTWGNSFKMTCAVCVCRHRHPHYSPGYCSALYQFCAQSCCHCSLLLRKLVCWLFLRHLALPLWHAGQLWSLLDICDVSAVA